MQGVELEAIQIEFDGAPGVRGDQIAEVVGQLGRRQVVYVVLEVGAHAPDGTAVGVDGFGLQAFELEVLEVGLVALIEISAGAGGLHAVAPHEILQNHPNRIDGVKMHHRSFQAWGKLLRVAASSNPASNPAFNPAFNRTHCGAPAFGL